MQPAQRVKAPVIGRNWGGGVVDRLVSRGYPAEKSHLQTELYGVKMTARNMLTPELRFLMKNP